MKPPIDLDKAAQFEAFGALTAHRCQKHRGPHAGKSAARFTPAQNRALSELARCLVKVAKDAGAGRRRVIIGSITLELRENGAEEILSIRGVSAS